MATDVISLKSKLRNAHRSKTILFNAAATIIGAAGLMVDGKEYIQTILPPKSAALVILICMGVANINLRFLTRLSLADKCPCDKSEDPTDNKPATADGDTK